MTEIGSNTFVNCPVPIVLEDRYFILERENNQDIFSVFTLFEGKPIFEIFRNVPQDNPITIVEKTSAGVITVGKKDGGKFLYKVRPVYKGSSIFGTIAGIETEIRITDRAIQIGTNTIQDSMISGFEVGISVSEDGSFAMGARLPQEAKHLFKKI